MNRPKPTSKIPKLRSVSAPKKEDRDSAPPPIPPKVTHASSAGTSPLPSPRRTFSFRLPSGVKDTSPAPATSAPKPVARPAKTKSGQGDMTRPAPAQVVPSKIPEALGYRRNMTITPEKDVSKSLKDKEAADEVNSALLGLIRPTSDLDMVKVQELITSTPPAIEIGCGKQVSSKSLGNASASPLITIIPQVPKAAYSPQMDASNLNLEEPFEATGPEPPLVKLTPLELHPIPPDCPSNSDLQSTKQDQYSKLKDLVYEDILHDVFGEAAQKAILLEADEFNKIFAEEEKHEPEAALPQAEEVKMMLSAIEEDDEEEVVFMKEATPSSSKTKVSPAQNSSHSAVFEISDISPKTSGTEIFERYPSMIHLEDMDEGKRKVEELGPESESDFNLKPDLDANSNPFTDVFNVEIGAASPMMKYTAITTIDDGGDVELQTDDPKSMEGNLSAVSNESVSTEASSKESSGWFAAKRSPMQYNMKQVFETSSNTTDEVMSNNEGESENKTVSEVEILYSPKQSMSNQAVTQLEKKNSDFACSWVYRQASGGKRSEMTNGQNLGPRSVTSTKSVEKEQNSGNTTQLDDMERNRKQVYFEGKGPAVQPSKLPQNETPVPKCPKRSNSYVVIGKTGGDSPRHAKDEESETDLELDFSTEDTDVEDDPPKPLQSLDVKEESKFPKSSITFPSKLNYNNLTPPPTPCHKKTKTIFSLEMPVPSGKEPTKSGDGQDVLPSKIMPPRDRIERTSSVNLKEEGRDNLQEKADKSPVLEQTLRLTTQANSSKKAEPKRQSLEKIPIYGGDSYQADLDQGPFLTLNNGTVEILKPVNLALRASSHSTQTLRSGSYLNNASRTRDEGIEEATELPVKRCQAILPKTSTLVLQRSVENDKVFCKPINIHNSTSCQYAFKVSLNQSADLHFSVFPNIGVVPPRSEVSVNVATLKRSGHNIKDWTLMVAADEIAIKIFRFHLANSSKLESYYHALEQEHADLIATQKIKKIVLWDSGDLPGTYNLLHSIQSREERQSIKDEVHQSQDHLRNSQSMEDGNKSVMNICLNIQNQMTSFNENLKELFEELSFFKNTQTVLCFVCFMLFIAAVMLPLLYQESDLWKKQEMVKVEEPSWFNKWILGTFDFEQK